MSVPAGPFIGFGMDFLDCATSGGSYATVGHVVDIETPDEKVGDTDVSYAQQATRDKLFISKLNDNGEAKMTFIWSNALKVHVRALKGTPYFFKVSYPDNGTTPSIDQFAGYYKGISNPMKLEDMVVCEVTLKVSGPITNTPGT